MLRALLLVAITSAAASAVAVPPYEPLPDNRGQSKPVSRDIDEVPDDSTFTFTPAVDNASSQPKGAPLGNPSWEMMSQMQQMQDEIQSLRGMVEELRNQVNIMQKQERERYLDLDMRINQLRGGEAAVKAPAPVTQSPKQTADDKALYQKASDHRKKNQFPEAISVLEQLLQQSPNGLYAPYSDYWLGELYMVTEPPQLDTAKKHFVSLLSNHSDHVKVPDAMYKLGKLYVQQGEKSKAKSTLTELVKRYPDKSAANLGKDLLKTL